MMDRIQDVPKIVIRDLALQFQETNDGEVFKRILLRVDRLVQRIVLRERAKFAFIRSEHPQDVYGAALVGLFNGVARIQEDETPDHVIAILIAYMRAAIHKEFSQYRKRFCSTNEPITDEPVFRSLECECIREVFDSLIDEGIISSFEFSIMHRRYVDKVPWQVIADSTGVSVSMLQQTLHYATHRVRHQLRMRGIQAED